MLFLIFWFSICKVFVSGSSSTASGTQVQVLR